MPHLIIEYSANIIPTMKTASFTAAGHKVMLESGLFDSAAIKSRSHVAHDSMVGEQGVSGQFLHALVYLMEGRSTEQKQTLAKNLMAALDPLVLKGASITVDVRELDKAVYQKRA